MSQSAASPPPAEPHSAPALHYRQRALTRLSSPEQLDQTLQVTPLRGWLALGALSVVVVAAVLWGWFGSIAVATSGQGILLSPDGIHRLMAASAGVVTQNRQSGETVQRGDVVVGVRTDDGTDANVVAERDGVVVETYVYPGGRVQADTPVANVEPRGAGLEATIFVPAAEGKQVAPGMPAYVTPAGVSADQYGVLVGSVKAVSPFPVSATRLMTVLENRDLVDLWLRGGPVYEVTVQLQPDPATPSGYRWSSQAGPPRPLSGGTLASADLVLGQQRPMALVLPGLGQ